MGHLYLVDRPVGENGLNLAFEDNAAKVVLIQDGVYLDCSRLNTVGVDVYAVRRDVERGGQESRLPSFVRVIDYAQLIDLIVTHKVINFA